VVFFLNLLRDDSAHILEGEDLAASNRQTDTATAATVATVAAAPTARPQVFDVGSTNDFPSLGAPAAAATKLTVTSQKRRIKPTKLGEADRPAIGNISAVASSSGVLASATAAEATSNSSRSVFSYSNAVAAAQSPPPPLLRAVNTMAAVAARPGTRRTAESLMGGGVIGSTTTVGFGSANLSVNTAGAFNAPKVASVQPRVLTVQRAAVLPAPPATSAVPQTPMPVVISTAQQQCGSSANAEEAKQVAAAAAAAVCTRQRAELIAALASIYAHIILCKVRCAYCT
jgi:hypothetical protein